MIIKALSIFIGDVRVGVLFQYGDPAQRDRGDSPFTTRFVADEAFMNRTVQPVISIDYLADSPEEQKAFWEDLTSIPLNGRFSAQNGWLLPAFFQNLLPEGRFRDHVAELRGCDPKDHFEMLAACGKDLPGNVSAVPIELSMEDMTRYVTQQQDSLEMSVSSPPMEDGVSLSGVQPKVGVIKEGDRYVGRTKDHSTHIIAKLPVVGQPRLPELEHLSLQLAKAAGATVCEAYLEPLAHLAVQHSYDLGDADQTTKFLAVVRYDREPGRRIHCEDFAQILGEMPEHKYGGRDPSNPRTYLDIAAVLMAFPELGEPAVHELLRRLVINEMLGNPDMHLKNVGLRYPDGLTPDFPPAYDIVAYAAFNKNTGHAMKILPADLYPIRSIATQGMTTPKQSLSPAVVRAFCAQLGIPEKPAAKAVQDCVNAAAKSWPSMIQSAEITDSQKTKLMAHLQEHPRLMAALKRKSALNQRDQGRDAAELNV